MNELRENVLEIYKALENKGISYSRSICYDEKEKMDCAADEAVAMDGDELRDMMRFCDVKLDMLTDEVRLEAVRYI